MRYEIKEHNGIDDYPNHRLPLLANTANGSAHAPYRLAAKNAVDRLTCGSLQRLSERRDHSWACSGKAKERAAGTGLDHSATWQRTFKVILTIKSIRGPVWIRFESFEWALTN